MKNVLLFLIIFLSIFVVSCKKDEPISPNKIDLPDVSYLGKTYHSVLIGNQIWLKENLDVGNMINGTQLQNNNGVIEKYCYENDPNNCVKYGGLYKWDEAMQYTTISGTKGICPSGFHIPTKEDFETLKATAITNKTKYFSFI